MTDNKIIVNKSTVPVGTADKVKLVVAKTLKTRGYNGNFHVVSNPEFLKEGAAVSDCKRPDRIVVGTESDEALEVMRELYAPFNRNHEKLINMDIRSAELTKYAANCMLATKISFMNEIANIADRVGADIEQVRVGIGSDKRIGYHFIYPGCGYGGSCFPKDINALVQTAEEYNYSPKIIQAVETVNSLQKKKLYEYICDHFGEGNLSGKKFAIWGLSFKPNTDDMRDASSRTLMELLWKSGATVHAFDPEAMEETQRIYGQRDDLTLAGTKEAALYNSDALIICTEWQNFKAPDFEHIKENLNEAVVFDGRNLFEPKRMESKGFKYYSIGRPHL